jgi:hypothetical protein
MPPLSPQWAAGMDPQGHLLGRVEHGRVEWMRWSEHSSLLPADLLRLEPPVRPFVRRTSTPLDPPLREFPSFLSEELPKVTKFEREEQRRLASLPEPKPSLWSRLFRRQPPSAVEWEKMLRPPKPSVGGKIRSFFDKLGGGSAGAGPGITPGFLRSEAMLTHFGVTEANWREGAKKDKYFAHSESPLLVGRAIVALARDPDVMRWSGHLTSSWEVASTYGLVDHDGNNPDWATSWRTVMVEQPAMRTGTERQVEWLERVAGRLRGYLGNAGTSGLVD